MATEAQSLVEWVNSFGEGECGSLKELSSGALLLKCMSNVLTDLKVESGQEWPALFQVLTEFCGCSLDQSISRDLIEAGDEEHLARAVVLLLCLAVQRKPNEDVISRITTLRYKAQCDIMYFIEEALAKMNSKSLSSGLFTSGVGDIVPALSGRATPEVREEDEPMEDPKPEISGCGQPDLVTPTRLKAPSSLSNLLSSVPRSASHRNHVVRSSTYYQGLESPAAVQWMQSQKKRPASRRVVGTATTNAVSPGNHGEELPEEVLKLQHRVRVLERSLLNEQTLSQEMHATLCQKEREIHEIRTSLQRAESLAGKARELGDVQDELQTVVKALDRSEKAVQRLQREMEEQRINQEEEVEKDMSEINRLETENSQLKELLERAVGEELEQRSEVKRLQLSGETGAIAFQAKQHECDSLLQLNQEYSSEVRELKQQATSLKRDLEELRDWSSQREKTLTDENHTLSLKLMQTQEQLEVAREQQKTVESECESVKQQLTVAEAGSTALLGQYETAVGEKEGLMTNCKMVEGQLDQARAREEEMETQLREKGGELECLREQLSGLEEEMVERGREMERKLEEREGEMAELRETSASQIRALEERCEAMKQEREQREKEIDKLTRKSSYEREQMQENLERLQEQLAMKQYELSSLTQTSMEQKQQMEELLSEACQKLNTLTERYTTEAEEMAAVKASLEEDLSRAHSELRDTRWELVERERALGEWEREAGAAREESKSLKSELDGVCEERERERREFGEKEEKMVEEMKSWVEVREQRWLMEREALENRTVELSLQLETLRKTTQRTLEEGQQLWEREREEEREGWSVEAALLQEQVSGLTEELEAVTGRAGEYERDIEGLREAVEKAQSLANTLQEEVSSKAEEMVALQKEAEEAKSDLRQEREARRESELILRGSLEAERKRLEMEMEKMKCAEVNAEKERWQAEFENLTLQSKLSISRLQADYQTAVAEKDQMTELYSSELATLKETNVTLQLQQSEASSETAALAQKQSDLHQELVALRETKAEVMELCHRYEEMYNEERERRQADREQIRMMRAEGLTDSKTVAMVADSLRKKLSDEKRSVAKVGAENRSLKAQVAFLERKLRDRERAFSSSSATQPGRPSLAQHGDHLLPESHSSTYCFKGEFENSHSVTGDILVSHYFSTADTTLDDTLSTVPQDQSTAGRPTPHPQRQGRLSTIPQDQSTAGRPTQHPQRQGRLAEQGDDLGRISELRSRNRKVLPHLKSSYAVELQEKKEDRYVLQEGPRGPRGKKSGNATSLRLTSHSIATDDTRKRTSGYRKLAGDLSFSGSPVSSRRRISDPATPLSLLRAADDDTVLESTRRTTLDPRTLSILAQRDENRPEVDESSQAGLFEMNFSPPSRPRVAARLPEKLRQRLEKPVKPVSATTAVTTTGRKQPSAARKSTQPPPRSSKRSALKTKN